MHPSRHMVRHFGYVIVLLLSFNSFAQPATEIYLFDLQIKKNKIVLSNGANITNHRGYDNQPFFHPDNSSLYFTQADTSGRTDIYVYDYSTRLTKQVTDTPEREYSPTVTPDKKYISCIIQRDDGVQDLGKYPIDGGDPIVLINNLKVGYHAWADNTNLILFVLGEPMTLHWYSLADNRDLTLADSIGRSLHAIPQTTDMSFIHKTAQQWWIKKIQSKDKTISSITETLPNREDLTWTPDGKIVMSDGEKLFYMEPGKGASWKEIETTPALALKGITRLSVSKDGKRLALVAGE